MNNIAWHTQNDDDFWELLDRHTNHDILIETNVTFRLSNTKYIEEKYFKGVAGKSLLAAGSKVKNRLLK